MRLRINGAYTECYCFYNEAYITYVVFMRACKSNVSPLLNLDKCAPSRYDLYC